jgi:EAL domain-containing protein (putative c-di-GMP-specific phosphodiesterase class I)
MMADDINTKSLLKDELTHALEHNEFALYYQPRFDHAGVLRGVEALIRWQHPVKGLIMPDRFIGFAEECGLIIPLGKWVMRAACEQIILWQGKFGEAPIISMTASIRELESDHYADDTLRIIMESGVSPSNISIEVTESMLMTDPATVTQHLNALTNAGVSIELDDFGTGFSSLSQLYRLPIKTIKIDRSFVNLIASSKESRSIIIAIIALAQALECEVIAEGVETLEQLDFLKACECNNYQGYYFAKPGLPSAAGTWPRFFQQPSCPARSMRLDACSVLSGCGETSLTREEPNSKGRSI